MNELEILLTVMNIIFFLVTIYIHLNMYTEEDESDGEDVEDGESTEDTTPKCKND